MNILIDGGTSRAYEFKNAKQRWEDGELKLLIATIKERGEKIDLLILTHVDDDHIGGILKWLGKDQEAHLLIGSVWFNSGRLINEYFNESEVEENLIKLEVTDPSNPDTSIRQGVVFENYITKYGIWKRQLIIAGDKKEAQGITFYILSPNEEKLQSLRRKWDRETPSTDTGGGTDDYHHTLKALIESDLFTEDTAPHNGSSIAFLLRYQNTDCLFLADAHPSIVVESLKNLGFSKEKPVQAALVKLSHHGSKANSSTAMFDMIESNTFVISTNGDVHNHPDKQLLARLISHYPKATLYFNYSQVISKVFTEQDYQDFPDFRPLSCQNEEFTYDH
ncbi:ComEC/Rec2 family competence protein [Telluribacter sp.]|jgi:beta-lactamase superfamily II metal-dependent hydrolase|uniref:ComEC/Rec2 family competence protein n=1 Tax=Telluribacter sp. TaxID=1978767 RepID=UPI002E14AC29|nr:MBL fold metallo-hydrolase [Telluribacter sp.]